MDQKYLDIRNNGLDKILSMYEEVPDEGKLEMAPFMYCIGHFVEVTDELNMIFEKLDSDDFDVEKFDNALLKIKDILKEVRK